MPDYEPQHAWPADVRIKPVPGPRLPFRIAPVWWIAAAVVLLAIVVVVGATAWWVFRDFQRFQARERIKQNAFNVQWIARYFILQELKHPHDATFPDALDTVSEREDGSFLVVGLIRAPNDLGATFTAKWAVIVAPTDSADWEWECHTILFQDRRYTPTKRTVDADQFQAALSWYDEAPLIDDNRR